MRQLIFLELPNFASHIANEFLFNSISLGEIVSLVLNDEIFIVSQKERSYIFHDGKFNAVNARDGQNSVTKSFVASFHKEKMNTFLSGLNWP